MNLFYFRNICKIGGTEVFLWEIAKKYNDYDITIYYDQADKNQLKRLKQFVRCKKRIKGEIVKCDRAFFNFNLDMIDDVESTQNYYAFVSHAIYQELGYAPPIQHPKLNHFIGVSQYSCDKLEEYGRKIGREIKAELCYNPLTLEPKEKVIRIVSAGRLDDKTKDNGRTLKLIEALDKYCERTGKHYIWKIFSNPIKFKIDSPNVVLMKPRVDVRPYMADADFVVQLSNDMETYCYTINEALGYGVPIITTPLSVLKELSVDNNMHLVCNWDMSNVDEIVKQIFERKIEKFNYELPKDNWETFLDKTKSTYKEELNMKYLVEATDKYVTTNKFDGERSTAKGVAKYFPQKGEQWEVDSARKDVLVEGGFVTVVKAIEEVEQAVKEPVVEKAVKKTTRKKTK